MITAEELQNINAEISAKERVNEYLSEMEPYLIIAQENGESMLIYDYDETWIETRPNFLRDVVKALNSLGYEALVCYGGIRINWKKKRFSG